MSLSKWTSHWQRRTALVTGLVLLLAHALAIFGFAEGLPPPPWGDEARFREQVLAGALALVWQPWRDLSPDAVWPASIGRWVVPVVLLWLLGEVFAVGLRRYLRRLMVVRRGGHAILFGLNPVATELLRAWVEQRRPALVLSEDDEVRSAALRAGAAHISGSWKDDRALIQSGAVDADLLACIAGSDTENIDAAIRLARLVEAKRNPERWPVQLLVHVEDPFLRASVDGQIDRFAAREVVQLRFFSSAQIVARRLLRAYPLDFWQMPAVPGPRLWIFGLTALAEELSVALLRLSVTCGAVKPAIFLLGRDAEEFGRSLTTRWPGANLVGTLLFREAPAEPDESLCGELLAQMAAPTGIYFCHDSDAVNLAAAMRLQTVFETAGRLLPPFYLRSVQGGQHQLRSELGQHPWFHHFGMASEIAEEMLLGEKLDAMAVRIHEHYVSEALARGEELGVRRSLQHWPLLPEDLKDDNRFVADHHFVKVRDTRCVLVAGSDLQVSNVWQPEEIEALSRVEHDRWMIQRLLAGWKRAEKRNDAARLHPDIVPWELLDEHRRELDRVVVRQVPDLLVELGLSLQRQRRVLVRGPRTPWAFPAAFDQAVDSLLNELCVVPEEAFMLWLEIDSAMAWRVADRMLAAGHGRIAIILREPLHGWLERLPSAEIRQQVLAMMRRCGGVRCLFAGESAISCVAPDSVLQLSVDGSDWQPDGEAHWVLDAAGRVLRRPDGGAP